MSVTNYFNLKLNKRASNEYKNIPEYTINLFGIGHCNTI